MKSNQVSRRQFIQGAAAVSLAFATPRIAWGKTAADVIIIGAGYSGLGAALILEKQGLDVMILEGSNRIGGRVLSLDDVPGHPEAGANAIVVANGRVYNAAKKFEAALIDRSQSNEQSRERLLVLGGKIIPTAEWPGSPLNPFPKDLKQMMPWEYVSRVASQNNPLKSQHDWYNPAFASYDVPIHDFLTQHGADDRLIQLTNDTNCTTGTTSHDGSALMPLAGDAVSKARQGAPRFNYVGKGGNQRVPEAIARSLKRKVAMRKMVTGIRSEADGVDVYCSDGTQYRARSVICSVPVAVLRDIRIDPVLTGIQEQAVNSMTYALCTQVHLTVKRPFWKDDGLPPSMWTDGIAGTVSPSRNGTDPEEITSIAARPRGFMARRLDRLGPEGGKAAVIKAIEDIRPAAKGQLTAVHIHSWELSPFAGGADFIVWGPGQVTAFHKKLWARHGRIVFCGEHTALATRGQEGAMESGERAASEVIEQLA